MNRKLLAAVVSGALALPMAAQVQAQDVPPHDHTATYEHAHKMSDGSMSPLHSHEHDAHPHADLHKHSYTLYGSVRSGIIVKDNRSSDSAWDLGAADSGDLSNNSGDQLWSRIGVKASHKLDNGMMAGLHIEKRLDRFRTRYQNVWLESEMGRITLGQQSSPYQGATSWDGANFMGGNLQLVGSRKQGASFASKLGGPFNFKALVMDDNSADKAGYGDGVDGFELSGAFDAGIVNINVGYADNDAASFMGVTVGGSLGKVGWEAGFETKNPDMSGAEDTNVAGLFVDYSIGAGAVYFYYESESGGGAAGDPDTDGEKAWVAGYSHGLGSGVKVIGEHRDIDSSNPARDGTTSLLAVVVGF